METHSSKILGSFLVVAPLLLFLRFRVDKICLRDLAILLKKIHPQSADTPADREYDDLSTHDSENVGSEHATLSLGIEERVGYEIIQDH